MRDVLVLTHRTTLRSSTFCDKSDLALRGQYRRESHA
uniref:Uncharacterized protein n=1 Tax=Anguilla anguilla TaxID=7936 RepID=A0A0E9TCR6_ANGAN